MNLMMIVNPLKSELYSCVIRYYNYQVTSFIIILCPLIIKLLVL